MGIPQARDIVDQNLTAIREGKKMRYVLSLGEVVDELDAPCAQACAPGGCRAHSSGTDEGLAFQGENHCRVRMGAKDRYACERFSRPRDGCSKSTRTRTIPPTTGLKRICFEADQSAAGGARSTSHNGEMLFFPPLVLPPDRNPTGAMGEPWGASEGPPHLNGTEE